MILYLPTNYFYLIVLLLLLLLLLLFSIFSYQYTGKIYKEDQSNSSSMSVCSRMTLDERCPRTHILASELRSLVLDDPVF